VQIQTEQFKVAQAALLKVAEESGAQISEFVKFEWNYADGFLDTLRDMGCKNGDCVTIQMKEGEKFHFEDARLEQASLATAQALSFDNTEKSSSLMKRMVGLVVMS
jgi:hypothetical protein